ncbi:MAG: anti-anti-sigma factor [Acidimicrobiaceae bacterium]|nr:anti-anti-sigma factor [Acidimicrobiaceae bacterium]
MTGNKIWLNVKVGEGLLVRGLPNFGGRRVALGLHFTSTETSLRPIGELDLATVGEFQAALLGFAGRRQRIVALDLSELSFVDATGLAAIIGFERQLREEERVLVLRHPSPTMKRVLDVTGLTWLLEVPSRPAPLHIEAVAPRDAFGAESTPHLVGKERRCN